MTDSRRKAKIVLLQQNRTFSDLARDAGLAIATVHNILNGRASSRKSKQALTNALRAKIFDDIEVTEHYAAFPKGCRFEFVRDGIADIALAKQFAREFDGFVRRRGTVITFLRFTPVKMQFAQTASNRRAVRGTKQR